VPWEIRHQQRSIQSTKALEEIRLIVSSKRSTGRVIRRERFLWGLRHPAAPLEKRRKTDSPIRRARVKRIVSGRRGIRFRLFGTSHRRMIFRAAPETSWHIGVILRLS
jgi:hypothetical protein